MCACEVQIPRCTDCAQSSRIGTSATVPPQLSSAAPSVTAEPPTWFQMWIEKCIVLVYRSPAPSTNPQRNSTGGSKTLLRLRQSAQMCTSNVAVIKWSTTTWASRNGRCQSGQRSCVPKFFRSTITSSGASHRPDACSRAMCASNPLHHTYCFSRLCKIK